jgi:hypothetical protein
MYPTGPNPADKTRRKQRRMKCPQTAGPIPSPPVEPPRLACRCSSFRVPARREGIHRTPQIATGDAFNTQATPCVLFPPFRAPPEKTNPISETFSFVPKRSTLYAKRCPLEKTNPISPAHSERRAPSDEQRICKNKPNPGDLPGSRRPPT